MKGRSGRRLVPSLAPSTKDCSICTYRWNTARKVPSGTLLTRACIRMRSACGGSSGRSLRDWHTGAEAGCSKHF